MSRARQLLHATYRQGYYLAMYTGVRALANLLRSRRSRLDPRLARLHGARLQDAELGALTLRVHSRRRPPGDDALVAHAMLSLQRPKPALAGWRYRALCMTSHFGCGHVEVALWEQRGVVTFYGVRNIATANARRLGFTAAADRMQLTNADEDRFVLRLLANALRDEGLEVRHASADDCIRLAVDERLIAPDRRAQAHRALRRRYERLRRAIAS